MESVQLKSFCPEGSKVQFFAGCLRDRAKDWWESVGASLGAAAVEAMTWSDFVTKFRAEYAPKVELHQLAREFLDMRQTTGIVAGITAKFRERALLLPQYAGDEEMRKTRYHDMLRASIREHVSYLAYPTLDSMIASESVREIDIEHLMKRNTAEGQDTGVSGKKLKGSDRPKGHQGRSRCGKCGKPHEGVCRLGSSGCYKCGKTGYFGKDCTATTPTFQTSDLIYFRCNQKGHIKADCLRLTIASTPVAVPAPTTICLTDGWQGKTEAPVMRSRAFLLTTEEAGAAPDMVTGIISSP
ncbi:uncharacterized protein LOC128133446 [Lactuca sativa]|uniref:uncharacterized protein LOC128133446 n=1 Tax=Lactuca sativa TaxID=4236 RepID=UPI0022AFD855|nr:uncharacterized protein LOC128133446 [Lactuca sativa]